MSAESSPKGPSMRTASLSSSAEELHLVPDVSFEGAVESPGVNRESQPLLGGRGDYEDSYNQFPGGDTPFDT